MKEKHLKIFAGVFVFLLLVAWLTKPKHKSVNIEDFVHNVVIGVSKEDVNSIEIYKETGGDNQVQMIFSKQDDEWRIPTEFNCKAQTSRIDRILNDLLDMTGKVRSSDPKHFSNYEISDGQGIHLLLKDEADKTLANLIIGKKGEDGQSGFVRFAGQEKVYSVDKNILSSIGVYGDIDTLSVFKDKSFVDLQAVNLKKEDLNMIVVGKAGKEMMLKKTEKEIEEMAADSTMKKKKVDEWVLVRGKREIDLDQKEVEKFFKDVATIRASEVVDRIGNTFADMRKSGKYGFDRPAYYVVYRPEEGQQKNLIFGKEYEKDKGYYMNVQWEGLVYKIAKYNYDKIWKWVDELPKKKKK